MNKKNYNYLFIVGTSLLVLVLPWFNYTVDRWRVLHSDYSHYYAGETPNKTFLKTKYLIEHPKQAKSILMGSSNGGYMDANLIAPNTYNMKYNFGLLAIHLQNVETMLKEGVKIENLWVGINDYIIWKSPKDYENSFDRSTYKSDFTEDIKTYLYYLFRKPNMKDLYLYQGKYRLLKSSIITDPQPHLEAKKRENEHLKDSKAWKKHMDKLAPTLLRYNDTTYRIDQAVSEIKELKKLCDTHHIKLKLFMYPVFYKAFLAYNQFKMEEFKKKLVKTMPFYDFYQLNDRAINGVNWQDSMHFSYSTGNFIIKSIQNGKYLVNSKNIEKDISENHNNLKNFIRSTNKKFFRINGNIDVSILDELYTFNNLPYTITKEGIQTKNDLNSTIFGNDIIVYLKDIQVSSKNILLHMEIESSVDTNCIFYYKEHADSNYDEAHTFRPQLKKGNNHISIIVPASIINNILRFDIRREKGTYKIKTFKLYK